MKLHAINWLSLVTAAVLANPRLTMAQQFALAEPRITRQLSQQVTLAWEGQALAAALQRLGEAQDLSIWLDRRVDPTAPVNMAVSGESVEQILSRLAEPHDLAAVPFQSVVYFGPRQTADELATLAVGARESLSRAAPKVRASWLKLTPWSYPRMSEPRALLRDVVAPLDVVLIDEKLVPHDLWPARTAISLAPLDRVVLLLAGFDLTCELSPAGKELRVTAIKRPVEITRRYPARQRRNAQFEEALKALRPDAVRERGQQLEVSARWELHEQLRTAGRAPASQKRPAAAPAGLEAQRFTLKIENRPLDAVLDQLAAQLQLQIDWSTRPPEGAAALISCDVRQSDLDGLLKAILAPAGYAAERDGRSVVIRPAR